MFRSNVIVITYCIVFFFVQAEAGIRFLVRSRGLGDVYKRQDPTTAPCPPLLTNFTNGSVNAEKFTWDFGDDSGLCLLYTSDAADERSSVDLGGRRIIKKKTKTKLSCIRANQRG